MNCKIFYGPKRPSRVRIDAKQGIHNPVDNIHAYRRDGVVVRASASQSVELPGVNFPRRVIP